MEVNGVEKALFITEFAYSDQVRYLIRLIWNSWRGAISHVAGYCVLPHWGISFSNFCYPFTLRIESPVNWILGAEPD